MLVNQKIRNIQFIDFNFKNFTKFFSKKRNGIFTILKTGLQTTPKNVIWLHSTLICYIVAFNHHRHIAFVLKFQNLNRDEAKLYIGH